MQPERLLGCLDQRGHVGVLVVGHAQLGEDEFGGRLDQGSGAAGRLGGVGVHDSPDAVDVLVDGRRVVDAGLRKLVQGCGRWAVQPSRGVKVYPSHCR